MEHRWGARSSLDVPVRIESETRAVAIAVLRDASVSGAFLCTSARLAPLTRIAVQLFGDGTIVEALVVRSASDGYGLEWLDVAPEAIVALLDEHTHAAHAAQHDQLVPEMHLVMESLESTAGTGQDDTVIGATLPHPAGPPDFH